MAILSDNMRGSFLMMASMASFTLNDAFIKGLAGQVPLSQAVFLRGAGTTLLIYLLARYLGGLRFDFSRRDWAIVTARNISEVAAAYFFLVAIFNMPLANATAILQVIPLAVTLGGAVFLGEQVGWRRFAAILIGFFGVMLIVRPGSDGFTIYSVYVLAAVAMVAVRDILSRKLSENVPSMTVALFNAASVTAVFGVASLFVEWVPLSIGHVSLLTGASIMIVGGYIFSVSAMRVGEIAFIAPFRYTALLWALALGILFFAERPDLLTLIGAAIVVVTGVYTFYRERRVALAAAVDRS